MVRPGMASVIAIAVDKHVGGRDSLVDATQLHHCIVASELSVPVYISLTLGYATPRTAPPQTFGKSCSHALTSTSLLRHSEDRCLEVRKEFGNCDALIDGLGQVHDGVQPPASGPALTSGGSQAQATQSLDKSTSTCSCANIRHSWRHLAQEKFSPDGQCDSVCTAVVSTETHCPGTAHYPTESDLLSVQFGRWFGYSMVFALARLSPKRQLRDDPSRLSLCTLRLTTNIETDPGHDATHTVLIYEGYINPHTIMSKMQLIISKRTESLVHERHAWRFWNCSARTNQTIISRMVSG